jgi:hypothetical protein
MGAVEEDGTKTDAILVAGSFPLCTDISGLAAASVVATTNDAAALGTTGLEDVATKVAVADVETVGSHG